MKGQFTIKYFIFREIWKIPCVCSNFPCVVPKFPVFSLSGKSDNQIPCFPCAVATLSKSSLCAESLSLSAAPIIYWSFDFLVLAPGASIRINTVFDDYGTKHFRKFLSLQNKIYMFYFCMNLTCEWESPFSAAECLMSPLTITVGLGMSDLIRVLVGCTLLAVDKFMAPSSSSISILPLS